MHFKKSNSLISFQKQCPCYSNSNKDIYTVNDCAWNYFYEEIVTAKSCLYGILL